MFVILLHKRSCLVAGTLPTSNWLATLIVPRQVDHLRFVHGYARIFEGSFCQLLGNEEYQVQLML